ncbi:YsnF/AvaK domain-containing protein [Vulgatibacter sp.]|uniref:YsnF/AvaK domain-containing protein n=1 Tax=Vulgatibacter sp. TaxID=1971226 RepID=UPI003565373B
MIGEIYEGMTVRSFDGTKLGKIERIGDGTFTIEKGLLSKERHEAKFTDVKEIRGDEAIVDLTGGAFAGKESRGAAMGTREGELRVPLAEERLEVGKTEREAGQVRVTKHVEVEEKQIKVPVRHEEVRVERVATEGRPAAGTAFQEESYSIPVHEEEIEVRKRPVVREEVRVAATSVEEEREISEPLRHERAEVETEGEIRGSPRGEPKGRY